MPNAVIELAIRAAIEAGRLALQGFRTTDLDVTFKQDKHDPVTEYDRRCEALIRSMVLGAHPDSTIIGEESEVHRGRGSLTWFIDPIDGTANYAEGIPMWAVSIGVAREHELIGGVIYDPSNEQLFWADERGAFVRDMRSTAAGVSAERPLRSSGERSEKDATVALNFPLARDLVHFPELALEQFAEATKSFAQIRSLGSTCIALAWIAAGWIDATVSFETNPWDVAAGAYLIRQAGGIFCGYDRGTIVNDSRSHLAPHYYAAVSGGEFELLHEIMRTQSLRPGTQDQA